MEADSRGVSPYICSPIYIKHTPESREHEQGKKLEMLPSPIKVEPCPKNRQRRVRKKSTRNCDEVVSEFGIAFEDVPHAPLEPVSRLKLFIWPLRFHCPPKRMVKTAFYWCTFDSRPQRWKGQRDRKGRERGRPIDPAAAHSRDERVVCKEHLAREGDAARALRFAPRPACNQPDDTCGLSDSRNSVLWLVKS